MRERERERERESCAEILREKPPRSTYLDTNEVRGTLEGNLLVSKHSLITREGVSILTLDGERVY